MQGTIAQWGFEAKLDPRRLVSESTALVDCLDQIDEGGFMGLGVLDAEGVLVGTLQLSSLRLLISKLTPGILESSVKDFITQSGTLLTDMPVTCSFEDLFVTVFEKFARYHCQTLHIVDETGKPVGSMQLKDAIRHVIDGPSLHDSLEAHFDE